MQRHTVPAIAAAALALLLTTGCGNAGDQAEADPEPTVTAATDDPTTETPAPDPEDDGTVGLTAEVEYEDGTELSIDGFTRGTSGEYGYPANAPYLRFDVKLINGSDATMSLGDVYVVCSYGKPEQTESEQVFDDKVEDQPMGHLRAGKTAVVPVACEMPEDETHVQIEVTPGVELETAIFVGEVE